MHGRGPADLSRSQSNILDVSHGSAGDPGQRSAERWSVQLCRNNRALYRRGAHGHNYMIRQCDISKINLRGRWDMYDRSSKKRSLTSRSLTRLLRKKLTGAPNSTMAWRSTLSPWYMRSRTPSVVTRYTDLSANATRKKLWAYNKGCLTHVE